MLEVNEGFTIYEVSRVTAYIEEGEAEEDATLAVDIIGYFSQVERARAHCEDDFRNTQRKWLRWRFGSDSVATADPLIRSITYRVKPVRVVGPRP